MAPGRKQIVKQISLALAAGLLILICASACEPEPTPLPVNLPTLPPPSPTAGTPAPLRYAVAPNALPYLSDDDKRQINASAQLIPLDAAPTEADLGTQYDIVVALGDLPGGTRTDTPLQIALAVDTSLPPLDNPKLVDILRRAFDSTKIVAALNISGAQADPARPGDPLTLRADLANAGYPDGFDVTVAANPAADALAQSLSAIGINARIVTTSEPTHLAFTIISGQVPANAIPLYTIPISYRAVDGLKLTFTASGFPIARK